MILIGLVVLAVTAIGMTFSMIGFFLVRLADWLASPGPGEAPGAVETADDTGEQ